MTTPPNVTPLKFPSDQSVDALMYAVELWLLDRSAVEQILARASSATLARAIFVAAQQEHPGRHIVLRHGTTEIDATP
jgi:hypothetical protein